MGEDLINKIVEIANSDKVIQKCESHVIIHEKINTGQVKRVLEALKILKIVYEKVDITFQDFWYMAGKDY